MSRLPRDLTLLPDLLPDAGPAGPGADARACLSGPAPAMRYELTGGENIQAWLASTRAGEHQQGWQQLTADNPSPAIYGRASYCPCESAGNRAELDSSVSIHSVERFPAGKPGLTSITADRRTGASSRRG
jgi:NADPH-dependent glutamate synthase beta subunit-like oxidoreductase